MSALTTWPIMKNKIDAVFFDLDGTLLDTAPDLYCAMLETLNELGHDPVSFEQFRPHVHTGTTSMLKGSLNIDENDPKFPDIRQTFLNHYENLLHNDTDYFPGMDKVLLQLEQHQIPWGIVTNKPAYLTKPLIQSFNLTHRCSCIISGDTLPHKKPNPAPLLHACEITKVQPQLCVYVGDTESDITAANAANMTAIAVLYGYHDPASAPETWGADHIVEKPLEILDMLKLSV